MRRSLLLGTLAATAVAALAPMALAGWGPDGVCVRATTSDIPVVAACTDGGSGTLVAWQETSVYPAGVLRVQHLLSSGDPDPAWPADGALASGVAVERDFVDVVPDRLGGVYVYWVETADTPSLFVTRLDPSGHVATGWPASGRPLGAVFLAVGRPRAVEDGSHGVYLGWTSGEIVSAQRLGPDGLGVGGWPNAQVTVVSSAPVTTLRFWPDLALGPDGGVFVSWATWSLDTTVVGSGMFLRRLTGAGANSSGWPEGGLYLGSFRPELLYDLPRAPLLDISPDARGGLFWIAGTLSGLSVDLRLHRILADGQASPGWPADGRAAPSQFGQYYYFGYEGPDEGLRVYPDGQDGAIVEEQNFYTDSPPITGLYRCTDAGAGWGLMQGDSPGHEVVTKGDGGAFMADYEPSGPFGPYAPPAFMRVDQSYAPAGWVAWSESHWEAAVHWYGDIALAPAGDDGVVFFWSQVRERFGLFARRFTTAGQVTEVEPGPGGGGSPGLHGLRFVSGTGVVARITLGGAPARLELFDVEGRQISARTLDAVGHGSAEVALPGTESLASGVYLVRLAWHSSAALGKVAVIR